jgi:hypothetical protein
VGSVLKFMLTRSVKKIGRDCSTMAVWLTGTTTLPL